jgi:hypothetical protein
MNELSFSVKLHCHLPHGDCSQWRSLAAASSTGPAKRWRASLTIIGLYGAQVLRKDDVLVPV